MGHGPQRDAKRHTAIELPRLFTVLALQWLGERHSLGNGCVFGQSFACELREHTFRAKLAQRDVGRFRTGAVAVPNHGEYQFAMQRPTSLKQGADPRPQFLERLQLPSRNLGAPKREFYYLSFNDTLEAIELRLRIVHKPREIDSLHACEQKSPAAHIRNPRAGRMPFELKHPTSDGEFRARRRTKHENSSLLNDGVIQRVVRRPVKLRFSGSEAHSLREELWVGSERVAKSANYERTAIPPERSNHDAGLAAQRIHEPRPLAVLPPAEREPTGGEQRETD